MTPKGPADLAMGWFVKAESDLANARTVIAGAGPYDTACFHCQQAAEKCMKGLLCARGQSFPFTHDLRRLATFCDALDPSLSLSVPDVLALTDYAVRLRYDNDFWPARDEAAAALAVAERVHRSLRPLVPPANP
jgi:HEPN domain-containing protein